MERQVLTTERYADYYPSGAIRRRTTVYMDEADGNITVRTEQIVYYENGTIQSIQDYGRHGKKEGECRYYYENGQLGSREYWKNERPCGTHKSYRRNGTLREETEYFPNGKKRHLITYDDYGKMEKKVLWYENGQVKSEETFFNNKYLGKQYWYFPSGGLMCVLDYNADGEKHGEQSYYNADGRKGFTERCYDGYCFC